ncbi:MAG TPA: tRNA (adenosine(37)-N6)-threonylcarbamoyltransferase complex ATPase subunit type 1 TsaE [Candidatus Dormibacteraeota bacterium]|nr:tRNA (adenosine(37)-N6)-threonylcarbamoyltransferase complex ATPase subunit type 1 TsaE [Candidatus Dormibacteraeota bacterium]
MNTFVDTVSADQTRELGHRLGQVVQPGDVIALEGDLGTGKTELVKGLAEGLGVSATVHSPTFVLHHRYQGRLPIEHFDLYRLEGMAWVDTGLDEPAPDAVTVIEWPERAAVLETWATTLIRLSSRGTNRRRFTLVRGPHHIRALFEHAPGD